MVQRLILAVFFLITLFGCNENDDCEYDLINKEFEINPKIRNELLFCIAYRDFLTDGQSQEMFVLKIDSHNVTQYLKDNEKYMIYTGQNGENVFNPHNLLNDLSSPPVKILGRIGLQQPVLVLRGD